MILINMNMPESCSKCRFHEHFNGNFYCTAKSEEAESSDCMYVTQSEFYHQRWKECPLKEIKEFINGKYGTAGYVNGDGTSQTPTQVVYHIDHVDTLNL